MVEIRVVNVSKGQPITKSFSMINHVNCAAPDDGVLISSAAGDTRIYLRFSDLEEILALRGTVFNRGIDPWRENDGASSEQVPPGNGRGSQ